MRDNKILIARIGAAHGVRGEVRLWPYAEDPEALRDYGPLETQDGARRLTIAAMRAARDHLVVRFDGISTRDDAAALNGLDLYVARTRLPPPADGEYYHADLIGLAALAPDGTPLGRIVAVHDFGAGDILELAPEKGEATLMLPFTDAVVPAVDLAAGTLTLVMPAPDDDDSSASRPLSSPRPTAAADKATLWTRGSAAYAAQAETVLAAMRALYPSASLDWGRAPGEPSEDGEAAVARDAQGEIITLFHLEDPDDALGLHRAIAENRLTDHILASARALADEARRYSKPRPPRR